MFSRPAWWPRVGVLPAGSLCASAPLRETTGGLVNLWNHASGMMELFNISRREGETQRRRRRAATRVAGEMRRHGAAAICTQQATPAPLAGQPAGRGSCCPRAASVPLRLRVRQWSFRVGGKAFLPKAKIWNHASGMM